MNKRLFAIVVLLAATFHATSQNIYHFPDCAAEYCIQAVFVNVNFDFDPDTLSPDDDRFVYYDDFAFYVNTAGEYLYQHGIEAQVAPENTSNRGRMRYAPTPNHKLQITNHKSQITSHKSQITVH